MSILVVGSVALDSIRTPFGERKDILGGSATFFSMAASLFDKVNIVAVVGEDFPKSAIDLFKAKKVGIEGLETVRGGKTFRWEGYYEDNLNVAHTVATHLNVFQTFKPVIPDDLRNSKVVFLANIDPELQNNVLEQMKGPKFVACDTMNYWISTKRDSLVRLLKKVDLVFLNDGEVRQLSGEHNLIKAAMSVIGMGAGSVVVKRGEHGAIYFSKKGYFIAPAYLLEDLKDPTGAGDSFAGGFVGSLSRGGKFDEGAIRKAVMYGSVVASFAVEDFSIDRLYRLTRAELDKRYSHFKKITKV